MGASAPPVASAVPTTAVDMEMPALDGAAAGPAPTRPEPAVAPPAQPWWMQAPAEAGTGPQRVPDLAGTAEDVSTGPHAIPMAHGASVTSGAHPAVTSGPHPAVTTGGHGAVTSGAHPVVSTGPQPAAAQAKGRTARRAGVILALAAAVGIVAALGVGAFMLNSGGGTAQRTGGQKAPKHRVTAAASAGGLQRAPGLPAASAAYPFIAAAVRAGGAERPGNVSAVYADLPARTQNVVFIGGTGQIGDPAAFLRKARPSTVLTTREVRPGRGGGRGMCGTFAVLSDVHVYCSWATPSSFGFVASNLPTVGDEIPRMAELMRRMRADLEK
ncbi:hypothetical protein [Actinomadura rubrobrunea]|uniref:hypothetical protein n=1 Tax=Actinomadura rubrobrunea TaxID=115335 RepID=UPI0011B23CA7|nr:hypothetical protein [Actinomadura rubrobrunea]